MLCWELLHWLALDAWAKPLLGQQAVPGWAEVFSQAWAWLLSSAQGLLAPLPGLAVEPLQQCWTSQKVQQLAQQEQAWLRVLQLMLAQGFQAAWALPLLLERQGALGWQAAVLQAAPQQPPWTAEAERAAAALPSCGPPAELQAATQPPARHCWLTRRGTEASHALLLRPALRLLTETGPSAQRLAERHRRDG